MARCRVAGSRSAAEGGGGSPATQGMRLSRRTLWGVRLGMPMGAKRYRRRGGRMTQVRAALRRLSEVIPPRLFPIFSTYRTGNELVTNFGNEAQILTQREAKKSAKESRNPGKEIRSILSSSWLPGFLRVLLRFCLLSAPLRLCVSCSNARI